jgi:membrane-bound metal-dependent hydrolase YbcI (DUF457 family)
MMNPSMPSPIGHALAGIVVALAADRRSATDGAWRFLSRPITLGCVALATLPDADLLFTGAHRTATHSVGGTVLVIIVSIAVTGWVTRNMSGAPASAAWGAVWILAAAHGSHLLTDWLGTDRSHPAGIQALWPFSDRWFISRWELFPRLERRDIFSPATIAINVRALFWELVLLGPMLVVLWRLRAGPRSSPSSTSG